MKKKRKEDENEYKNWFWNSYHNQWIRVKPRKKPQENQTSQPNLKVASGEVRNAPELVTQDLKNLFCRGRYRSWELTQKH